MADRLVSDEPIFKRAIKWHDDPMKAPHEGSTVITLEDIRLIQESFRRVEAVRASATERFYRELFSYDDSLRGFFPSDRWSREEQLMSNVREISDALGRPEVLKAAIDALATRWVAGMRRTTLHLYLGAAWFSTLEMVLGAQFERKLHAAWFKVFEHVVAELRATQTPADRSSEASMVFAHASAA